jgi:hypothetical protein
LYEFAKQSGSTIEGTGLASAITCGTGEILLPTVIVERKCLNGGLYVAENQLFGSMLCATTALSVIYARLGIEKQPLVYGFTNVGNTFDLWVMKARDSIVLSLTGFANSGSYASRVG